MTLYIPLWVKFGVQSKDAVPLALSVKVAPAGSVEADSVGMVASASVAERAKLRLAPSETVWLPMAAKTGGWLPASLTVMATISESEAVPSEA